HAEFKTPRTVSHQPKQPTKKPVSEVPLSSIFSEETKIELAMTRLIWNPPPPFLRKEDYFEC
ncbi:MAG TPA: hypothetical protein QF478_13260, partial [Verrucomicrobiota bacterium]|nr:hypothetical protein [Verrucomicrobiota bacterium]